MNKKTCVENCHENDGYIYEYNNAWMGKCPLGA